jgi:hypothetical protein
MSRAFGSAAAARARWRKHRHRSGCHRDGGTPWRECKSRLKRPPGCCRPRTFFTKHGG